MTSKSSSNLFMHKNNVIDQHFKDRVAELVDITSQLTKSESDFVLRTIMFSISFLGQFRRTANNDPIIENQYQNYLFNALKPLKDVSQKAVRSKYIKIGENAKKLLEIVDYIPPSRDAIYEIASALEDDENVHGWIKAKKLSSQSTLRDVLRLRNKKVSMEKSHFKKHPYCVKLYFGTSSDAARSIRSLVFSKEDFKLASQKALASAFNDNEEARAAYERRCAA